MSIYVKVNNTEYPATVNGNLVDRNWNGRDTKTIYLTMSYDAVAALLPDNTPWSIVQRETVNVLDEQGQSTGETKEVVNEYDNSEYSLAGDITDHRDGTVSIKMGITAWAYPVAYAEGDRRSYGGKVYKCRQAHTSQTDRTPDKTPALWAVIDAEHAGTQADPIPASRGMEYEYGKYYLDSEDGKTYKCERTGEAAGGKIVLQYLPHELVGNYFTAV